MFGSQMIEVLIGLGFLFFLLSVIVTTMREFIEGLMQTRAVNLERGIRELLRDPDGTQWAKALYAHPQISALFRGEYDPEKQLVRPLLAKYTRASIMMTRAVASDPTADRVAASNAGAPAMTQWKRLQLRSNLPSYIPSRNFAAAMLDLTGRGAMGDQVTDATAPLSFAQIRAGVATLPNPTLQRAMLLALDNAKGDIDRARGNLEAWFDSTMDRVSGWYRKETQTILFAIGLALAAVLNVDTIRVANALSQNQTLRETIVAKAQESIAAARPAAGEKAPGGEAAKPDANGERIDKLKAEIEGLGYPIGWSGPKTFGYSTLAGWLITAFALTLGAPFWFDLLNKLMVIRSTVKPHEKSPEEASEDRGDGGGKDPHADPAAAAALAAVPAPVADPAPSDDAADGFTPHEWADGRPAREGVL